MTPVPDSCIDDLIALPLGLDVWERHTDHLIVAASGMQLAEIERRRLAHVERVCTVAEFISRQSHSRR
jgi:hypothetical protein